MIDMSSLECNFLRKVHGLKHLAVAVALLSISACARFSGTSDVFHDTSMDFGSIKTVALMPIANLSKDAQGGDRVRDVFATMLMANSGIYVIPPGEVARAIATTGVANPTSPTIDEVVKLSKVLKADAVITGVLREYGEVRAGTAAANEISLSMQMLEGLTGKIVWSASTTKGGIGIGERLLGGGGQPLNVVTEKAVNELLNKLFQ
jgi:polysaccharide biosynthesis protein PelC